MPEHLIPQITRAMRDAAGGHAWETRADAIALAVMDVVFTFVADTIAFDDVVPSIVVQDWGADWESAMSEREFKRCATTFVLDQLRSALLDGAAGARNRSDRLQLSPPASPLADWLAQHDRSPSEEEPDE